MKRLSCALLALTLSFALCACGGNTAAPTEAPTQAPTQGRCYHSFTSEITLDPTCETEGEKTYTCTLCGFSYTDVLEIVDHSFSEATCNDAPFCAYCGTFRGEPLGHELTMPTCTQGSVCLRCGFVESPAAGHTFEDGVCTQCGAEEN